MFHQLCCIEAFKGACNSDFFHSFSRLNSFSEHQVGKLPCVWQYSLIPTNMSWPALESIFSFDHGISSFFELHQITSSSSLLLLAVFWQVHCAEAVFDLPQLKAIQRVDPFGGFSQVRILYLSPVSKILALSI